jgi:anti-sigma regulatory factor (Ser/Thr protein kinase)
LTGPTPPLQWVWPLTTRAGCLGAGLTAERHAVMLGWSAPQSAELSLVVVELCTNALRHGHDGTCTLTLALDEVWLEVRDKGPGYPPWVLQSHAAQQPIEQARPSSELPRGLGAGLDVVRRLTSELVLTNDLCTGGAKATARITRRP